MDRRRFLLSALAGPLVAPLAVHAQGTAKLPKLGVLYTNTAITPAGLNPAFWERLRELGWDNNPVFTVNRDRVVALAAKSRLPAIYEYASWPNASTRSFAAPGRSTKFELVINLTSAKALGLTIPRSVLLQANRVIQ